MQHVMIKFKQIWTFSELWTQFIQLQGVQLVFQVDSETYAFLVVSHFVLLDDLILAGSCFDWEIYLFIFLGESNWVIPVCMKYLICLYNINDQLSSEYGSSKVKFNGDSRRYLLLVFLFPQLFFTSHEILFVLASSYLLEMSKPILTSSSRCVS